MAEGLATLPDKSWAEKQLIACMKSWLDLRVMNVPASEDVRELKNIVQDVTVFEDNAFLSKLDMVKQQIQAI